MGNRFGSRITGYVSARGGLRQGAGEGSLLLHHLLHLNSGTSYKPIQLFPDTRGPLSGPLGLRASSARFRPRMAGSSARRDYACRANFYRSEVAPRRGQITSQITCSRHHKTAAVPIDLDLRLNFDLFVNSKGADRWKDGSLFLQSYPFQPAWRLTKRNRRHLAFNRVRRILARARCQTTAA